MRLKLGLWCLVVFLGLAFGLTGVEAWQQRGGKKIARKNSTPAAQQSNEQRREASQKAAAERWEEAKERAEKSEHAFERQKDAGQTGGPFREGDRAFDKPGEATEFHRMKRAPQMEGPIPVERYFTAQQRINAMPRYSTALDQRLPPRNQSPNTAADERLGTWVPLGPGNVGGRTRAFLIHPTNPNIMYAGGVAGGVWKTTNGGGTWSPLTDLIANLSVVSLAMDPKNPSVLYAGTGEGIGNGDGNRGAGIFKTTDEGVTWTRLAATATANFYYVNDLVISPTDSARVYAATRTGVWRSLDAGVTWTQILDPAEAYGCLDLVIRTDRQTDFLFASCGNFVQAAVYRNVQAESSSDWVSVLTEPEMGRTSLALAPSNQNIIYALSSSLNLDREDALHAVFRSNSSGDPGTWTAPRQHDGIFDLNTVLLTNAYFQFSLKCLGYELGGYSQGWYDNVIAVDPVDPEKVWVGGIDLFRSDDGGVTWGLGSYWWKERTDVKYAHADQHVIAFHPQYNGTTNQQMFVANDGGIQRTDNARATTAKGDRAMCDSGLSQITWRSLNNNYGVTQFYHGVVWPNGTEYMGGTQDNGTIVGEDRLGVNGWYRVAGGDGGYVANDPNHDPTLYVEFTYLSLYKTHNNGSLWRSAITGITEGQDNFLFITPYTMDPRTARRLWLGGRTLWRTKDKADFWTAASTQLVGKVSATGVSPMDGNRVLAGVAGGNIYRSNNALTTDAATTWANTRPRGGYVSWITWDPVDPNVAYATYSSFNFVSTDRHIYKTTDAGVSWTAIDGTGTTGIPDIPVHCILVDPRKTNVLYVGTDLGVFVSTDGGANWLVENTGFANVVTESLSFNSSNGLTHLYAFTHGRGAFKVRLSGKSAPEIVLAAAPSTTPLVTNSVTATVTVRATGGKPTGKVTFRDNFNDTIVRVLDTVDLDANGQARITFPANSLSVGWHYISVDYSGDAIYNAVRSNELELNVLSNVVDLTIRKSVNAVMGNGATSIYTLAVRNVGNSPSTGPITVVDTLPLGLTFLSHTGANWSCGAQGQIVTCTFGGTLNGNTESAVQLSVRVGPEAVPKVTNTATCSTAGEVNLANNSASLTSEVKPGLPIDLSIGKTHIGTFVRGANGVYTITVRNAGPVPTNATLTVEDILPVGYSFVSATGTGWNCSASGQLVTCTNAGVLNPATNSTITLTVAVGASAAESSVNRACVIHPGDINVGNNCANDTTVARTGVDLEMRKGHAGDFGQGGTGVYSLSVRNLSVIPSTGTVTVTDTLPTGLTYASYAGIGWTCSANGQTVTCTNPNAIAPQAVSVIFLTVNVAANAAAQVTNTATCSNANEVYTPNNTSSDVTRIVPRTDLAVAISAADNPAVSGAPLTYTATVRNSTATVANAVDITVTLPTGVSPQAVNPPTGWTVSLSGNSVKFIRTAMAGNEIGILPIQTTTNPGIAEGAALTTSVRVASTTSESSTANNSASTVTRFITRAELSAALRVDGRNPALEADLLTYTLTTTNAGPSVALAVVAASKLSPGLVITECTPLVSGTCTPTVDGVNVTYPSLNAAATATVRIVAKVVGAQVQGATLTHNVNVSTTTTDQNLTNNIASVSVGAAPAQMQLTIDGGKTQFDFAAMAAMRELVTTLPSQLFSVKNLGVAPLDLNLILRRTGTEVTSGKIGNADDSATFPLYLLPEATGSETLVAAPIKVNGGVTRRFRLAYQPLLPLTVNRITNLAAAEVIPENLTSGLTITPSVGTAQTIPITARTLTRVQFVHPTTPRQLALPTISKNGQNEHVVTFSAHDTNGDVTSVSYQFLDKSNVAVGAPTSYPLAAELTTMGVLNGQSFTIVKHFPNASARPTVNRVRITLTDRAGTVTILSAPLPPPGLATTVSAANYKAESITNGAIVAVFGTDLAPSTLVATTVPLPTTLAGTRVLVTDVNGTERPAPLFFVSPGQINYQIPEQAAFGVAKVTIQSGTGSSSEGMVTIVKVGPAIFTSDASGKGIASGLILRMKKNNAQTYEPIARYDTTTAKFVAVPIDFGTATGADADRLFLILFGTGWRANTGISTLTARIVNTGTTATNPVSLPILYAGAQGSLVGLDQLNLQLPTTLKGRATIDFQFTAEGKAANTVMIMMK